MAISEQDRHDLHGRLGDVLGTKEATTLMEHLPPGGWRELATKTDLAGVRRELRDELRGVEERLRLRLDMVDDRIAGVEERLGLRLGLRLDMVDDRVGAVEERLGLRLETVDDRIDGMEERLALRLEASQDRLRTELYQGLAGIQREMRVQGFSLLGGVSVVMVVVTAVGRFL